MPGDALTVSDGMVGGFLTLSRYGAINDDVALLCYAHLGDFETEEIPANVTRTAVCQLVRANVGHPCVCAAGERPKVRHQRSAAVLTIWQKRVARGLLFGDAFL